MHSSPFTRKYQNVTHNKIGPCHVFNCSHGYTLSECIHILLEQFCDQSDTRPQARVLISPMKNNCLHSSPLLLVGLAILSGAIWC